MDGWSNEHTLSSDRKKKIVMIDGNNLAYRAYFALPATIATSSGVQTNSVYGFTSMLIKLLQEEKPDALVVAFDSAAPTFRHRQYAGYKAQRLQMPDQLHHQLDLIEEVIEAFGIPIVKMEGYEADDILGTLAKGENKKVWKCSLLPETEMPCSWSLPRSRLWPTEGASLM